MADHITVVSGPGAVWASAMALWDAFATGTYTSWAYARNNVDPMKGEKITVGLPAGGTDTFTFLDPTCRNGERQSLLYLMNTPGWRMPLTKCYANPLPSGASMTDAYHDGPRNLRREMVNNWTGVSPDGSTNDVTDTEFGITGQYYCDVYVDHLAVATDAYGVYFGTPTYDGMQGYPSDFVGGTTMVVPSAGGGGGSIDLTPVVAALEDIATRDVDYTFNNGSAIFSMQGKVAV